MKKIVNRGKLSTIIVDKELYTACLDKVIDHYVHTSKGKDTIVYIGIKDKKLETQYEDIKQILLTEDYFNFDKIVDLLMGYAKRDNHTRNRRLIFDMELVNKITALSRETIYDRYAMLYAGTMGTGYDFVLFEEGYRNVQTGELSIFGGENCDMDDIVLYDVFKMRRKPKFKQIKKGGSMVIEPRLREEPFELEGEDIGRK